jgi:hypothetical protein
MYVDEEEKFDITKYFCVNLACCFSVIITRWLVLGIMIDILLNTSDYEIM